MMKCLCLYLYVVVLHVLGCPVCVQTSWSALSRPPTAELNAQRKRLTQEEPTNN